MGYNEDFCEHTETQFRYILCIENFVPDFTERILLHICGYFQSWTTLRH